MAKPRVANPVTEDECLDALRLVGQQGMTGREVTDSINRVRKSSTPEKPEVTKGSVMSLLNDKLAAGLNPRVSVKRNVTPHLYVLIEFLNSNQGELTVSLPDPQSASKPLTEPEVLDASAFTASVSVVSAPPIYPETTNPSQVLALGGDESLKEDGSAVVSKRPPDSDSDVRVFNPNDTAAQGPVISDKPGHKGSVATSDNGKSEAASERTGKLNDEEPGPDGRRIEELQSDPNWPDGIAKLTRAKINSMDPHQVRENVHYSEFVLKIIKMVGRQKSHLIFKPLRDEIQRLKTNQAVPGKEMEAPKPLKTETTATSSKESEGAGTVSSNATGSVNWVAIGIAAAVCAAVVGWLVTL